ncbi:MAG: DUF1667 domain-containing protein [candidate division FCPU426 bacterium]
MRLTGNKCPKGLDYGKQEIENPLRTLATTVLAQNLEIKMVPVRTSLPIPRAKLAEAMEAVKRLRLNCPVDINQVIVANFLGLGVDLVATRSVAAANYTVPR